MASLLTLIVLTIILIVVWKYILATFLPPDINRLIGILIGLALFVYAMGIFGFIQWPVTR